MALIEVSLDTTAVMKTTYQFLLENGESDIQFNTHMIHNILRYKIVSLTIMTYLTFYFRCFQWHRGRLAEAPV